MRFFKNTKNTKPNQGPGAQRSSSKPKADGPPSRRKMLFEAMEPRLLLSATAGVDASGLLTILGDGAADTFVLTQTASGPGGVTISLAGTGLVGSFSGVKSILLTAGAGIDNITIANHLDLQGFLKLYGNAAGAPPLVGDPGIDSVIFSGGVATGGGLLEVFADHITVASTVALSTLAQPGGIDGDIVFRARRIGTAELENATPVGFVTDRNVSITIGQDAQLDAANIYLVAQAEDRSYADILGPDRFLDNVLISPLVGLVSGLGDLPGKLLLKSSTAEIFVDERASIKAAGTIGVYATAKANASGAARSSLVSIGYAEATASASITLSTDASVTAGKAAVLISTAGANAAMKTETKQDAQGSGFAASLAVSNATVTSKTTVEQGASVHGNTANVIAIGEIESEAESEAGTNPDGTAGLSFSLEFSNADVKTRVDGYVKAEVGEAYKLKIAIDPTVTDPTKQGYVHFDNPLDPYANAINIGPHGLVTEDGVSYDMRRGTSIGGLVDDQPYVVINVADDPLTTFDESNLIRLALTEQNAIDGVAVKLGPSAVPSMMMNEKTFTGSAVTWEDQGGADGAAADSIKLDNAGFSGTGYDFKLMGLTFELGQPVKYTQGSAPIPGLVDGETYYVISGLNEFDLQGDNRFVQTQVIQLAETYAEARAGIAIDLGAVPDAATNFKLQALHVLVPPYGGGAGIIAELKVQDTVSATAGIEPEDPGFYDNIPFLNGKPVFESILGALTGGFAAAAQGSGAGASSFQVAGALAFSKGVHSVLTTIGGTADIESNGDIDVKALIDHGTSLRAESSIEPEEPAVPDPGNPNPAPATEAAANAASVAVVVGLYKDVAKATIEGGAELDALRATRVISLIEHPYASSPDELFPSTLAEFVDSIQTEGFEAINKYLDGTFGLQSSINSWARATAEADKISVAGSVTFLQYDNDAVSLVEDGAKVNQDVAFRTYATNPHKNNQVNEDSDPAYEGQQVVSVEASNYMELIDVAEIGRAHV